MRFGPIAIGEPTLNRKQVEGLIAFSRGMERFRADVPVSAPATAKPQRVEIGSTGNNVFGGTLGLTDYNLDLQPPQCYETYDKMRKSDGQVRAALSVIKLPLLSVDWHVESASDDPEDIKIASWLNDKLDAMTITKSSLFRQSLLMLDYGSMPFEKVWELDADNLVSLHKLAPRKPATVTAWNLDDNGGLTGITQTAIKGDEWKTVDIPVEKLLVFVNEQEGSDFRGISVLRAAYKHWYFKDKMYIIDAIGKERRSIGVDVGTLKGETIDNNDKRALEVALMGLHAHEKQFFVEQEDRFTYRVEGTGDLVSAMESIEHHDTRILRSVLAEFLAMGEGSSGSLAMHKDKSSFFIMALESVAQNVLDTWNRYLIPQWVDFNWRVQKYPQMVHSRLDTRNIVDLADAVAKFVTAGFLTPGETDEQAIRVTLDLPEKKEIENPGEEIEPITEEEPRESRSEFAHVNFVKLERTLDNAETRIVEEVRKAGKRQIDGLIREAMKCLDADDLDSLTDLAVPYREPLARSISAVLLSLHESGRQSVSSELSVRLDQSRSIDASHFLLTRARGVTNILGDRLKSALVFAALDMYRLESINEQGLRDALTALSDREIKKIAESCVSEALNLGRDEAARQIHARMSGDRSDHVSIRIVGLTAEFSSVMDKNTCGDCASADGLKVEVGTPEYFRLLPPYKRCDGRGRCRCIFVYREVRT